MKEAMIEMWAELVLVALRSRGVSQSAKRFWIKQSHWISDTNEKAREDHNENDSTDYAWRYLSGRKYMYEMHGIELPAPRSVQTKSVRFTHPALEG
jgi:hypothetical protein